MAVTKFNGNRMRKALQFRETRLSTLSENTKISKQSLSAYVNGIANPPLLNIIKISNVLDFPIDYFFEKDENCFETRTTYFRSQMSATKMSRESQKAKIEIAANLYKFFTDSYITFPAWNMQNYELRIDDDPVGEDVQKQIEVIANKLRKEWGLNGSPIENVQNVLETHGIIVTGFPVKEDDKIDAFSQKFCWDDKTVMIIALGIGAKPITRLRFDMCHELGHMVLHASDESDEQLSHDDFIAMEKQANFFASDFLLPKEEFLNDILLYPTDINYYQKLKEKWHVSMQAMAYRAYSIKAISLSQFQYMMRQFSKRGYRKAEPGDIPGDIGKTFYQASIDLLYNGGYLDSCTLINEMGNANIKLNPTDLEEIMHLAPGTLQCKRSTNSPVKIKMNKVN